MTESISAALDEVVASCGLYLETVKVGRGGKNLVVKVVVDLPSGPGGVDSDRLTEVSRDISQRLDDVDLVQGAYTLEVSTPGAERTPPLFQGARAPRGAAHGRREERRRPAREPLRGHAERPG